MAFGFLKKAVRSAGRGVRGVAKGVGQVSKLAGKIPVVGKGVKGVFDITTNAPFQIASNISRGQRIDKVAAGALKAHVSAVKDVAPYAQMVISNVPGVGQGVSGAISAGLALAGGQPIDKAIVEGIKGAIPGGPLAKSMFDVGQAAVQGKPIDKVVLNALPIPAAQKNALITGLGAVKGIAQGKKASEILMDAGQGALSPDIRKALNIGIAVGQGQNLQKLAPKLISPATMKGLASGGLNLIKTQPMLQAAGKVLSADGKAGFSVANGLLARKVSPIELTSVRARLTPTQRKGFDVGLATRIGVTTKAPPKGATPAQAFGYYTTAGLKEAAPKNKVALLKTVITAPDIRKGAEVAVTEQKALKSSWWRKLLVYVGVIK